MRQVLNLWVLAAIAVDLFGWAASEDDKEPVGQNLIILLIDGYGASLLNKTDEKFQTGVQTLIENGVQAEYLQPVFPSQSYPNWFSLSTG